MGGADRASLRAGIIGALLAAGAVSALFLAAGAFEDGPDGPPAAASTTTTPATPSVGDVYRRARLGVVLIDHRPPGVRPRTGAPTRDDGVATGTGFVVDRAGHVVTNQHIVAGRGTTTVQFGPGEKRARATVVRRDASTDLAVVRVDRSRAPRLAPLPLGDSDSVGVGDPALAIGNPFGLERSLSVGVVSALGRRITAPDGTRIRDVVQTDAAINPGNSGGPLLDGAGRVIGVMTQGRGSGIAFAVPVDTVRRVVRDARRRPRPER
ncbi:MAG: trypsin-like peptidase domain-containing protein [Solirubrobacteraceae bacterium]|nr:trypsin-like peptidase domain-containing protein [Solirubrobacteraceae bacterium]